MALGEFRRRPDAHNFKNPRSEAGQVSSGSLYSPMVDSTAENLPKSVTNSETSSPAKDANNTVPNPGRRALLGGAAGLLGIGLAAAAEKRLGIVRKLLNNTSGSGEQPTPGVAGGLLDPGTGGGEAPTATKEPTPSPTVTPTELSATATSVPQKVETTSTPTIAPTATKEPTPSPTATTQPTAAETPSPLPAVERPEMLRNMAKTVIKVDPALATRPLGPITDIEPDPNDPEAQDKLDTGIYNFFRLLKGTTDIAKKIGSDGYRQQYLVTGKVPEVHLDKELDPNDPMIPIYALPEGAPMDINAIEETKVDWRKGLTLEFMDPQQLVDTQGQRPQQKDGYTLRVRDGGLVIQIRNQDFEFTSTSLSTGQEIVNKYYNIGVANTLTRLSLTWGKAEKFNGVGSVTTWDSSFYIPRFLGSHFEYTDPNWSQMELPIVGEKRQNGYTHGVLKVVSPKIEQ